QTRLADPELLGDLRDRCPGLTGKVDRPAAELRWVWCRHLRTPLLQRSSLQIRCPGYRVRLRGHRHPRRSHGIVQPSRAPRAATSTTPRDSILRAVSLVARTRTTSSPWAVRHANRLPTLALQHAPSSNVDAQVDLSR